VAGLNLVTSSALQASTYAFSVALSAILVWDLGVPSFILAMSLDTLLMKCRFGLWL
jgi:hypothetical protein